MNIKLDPGAFPPTRAHSTDAGLDIYTPKDFYIRPGKNKVIDTGVHIQLPAGTVGLLKSKSGLNVKNGITSEGVIDEGYTGSIVVKLYNHGEQIVLFERGDKITQLLVMPVQYVEVKIVDVLNGGERGENGFGSTGR